MSRIISQAAVCRPGTANAVDLHMPGCFTMTAQELYLEGFVRFGKEVHLFLFLVPSPDWQELLAKESRPMVWRETGVRCRGMRQYLSLSAKEH